MKTPCLLLHASPKATMLILAVALLVPGSARSADPVGCPPSRPILNALASVKAGQGYALTWTNVLTDRVGPSDYFLVERSTDGSFLAGVERFKTTRSSYSLPASPVGAALLFHRVLVVSSCPGISPGSVVSNIVTVRVDSGCPAPDVLPAAVATPENPPAYTTYVVTWDTSASGPGPGGGGPSDVKYRLRRVAPYETRETVSEGGSASFTDPEGDYTYQVRAESSCGIAGPWSASLKVTVGSALPTALVLLSEPRPIAVASPTELPTTSFTVRNGGTKPVEVEVTPSRDVLEVLPAAFTLGANESRTLTVRLRLLVTLYSPLHESIELRAGDGPGTSLRVPIDAAIAANEAPEPVRWSEKSLEFDWDGAPVYRTLVNPANAPAAFVSSVRQPWILVDSLDGQPWDRPLGARESRVVQISVDRGKRRATTGTETAVVSILTVGHEEVVSLTALDDGARLSASVAPVRPSSVGAKTRLLYAAMPNAPDAAGIGRFSSDLWLSNLDATAPIDVALLFTPIVPAGQRADVREVGFRMAPGETRRYRNILANALGYEGACELEVRSPSPTLSATVLVNNQQISATVPASARSSKAGDSLTATTPASVTKQYGFEMRPTIPGEGAKASDPAYVLTGLSHIPGRKRTNILLTETTGFDADILVSLHRSNGDPIVKDGVNFEKLLTVPALGTLQLNDDELFPPESLGDALYARFDFKPRAADALGNYHGAIVPFGTVIDQRTQDGSLRVGVSEKALSPTPPVQESLAAFRGSSNATPSSALALPSRLPFGGGPAQLFFPAVHLPGAPLLSGERPYWRTRVTLTNVNLDEQRLVRMAFRTQTDTTATVSFASVPLPAGATFVYEDILEDGFLVAPDQAIYGTVQFETSKREDGSWQFTWQDIDVQTETYTLDPNDFTINRGQFSTGMEAVSYLHGYSSFQSNLGTAQFDGGETSSRVRTNLVLTEVGGASCTVAVSAYLPGSFVPIASAAVRLPPLGYVSKELFRQTLGLDLTEVTDVRVVVRQIDGDGVFLAFASKINLESGDPDNILLRPATAGTGR